MEWQPIETAPADGSEFLGYEPIEGIAVMYKFTGPDGIFYWDATSQCIEMHPTHWMPLPEAPNVQLRGAPKARPSDRRERT